MADFASEVAKKRGELLLQAVGTNDQPGPGGEACWNEFQHILKKIQAKLEKNPESHADEVRVIALAEQVAMNQIMTQIRVGILEQFIQVAYESMGKEQWANAMENMSKLTLVDVLPPNKDPEKK